MTSPIEDAKTLFGADAMGDRKRLRRAYARLVKQHPPDADPVMFQRIRAALEAAQDALDRPDASPPELDLDAHIDALTPAQFRQDLTTLETAGLTDPAAAVAALFLVHATQPAEVVDWLVALRQRGMHDTPLRIAINALLDVRPQLALDRRIPALEQTAPPAVAAALIGYRVRALIREEQFDAAFALWQDTEKTLRALDTASWTYIADAILFYAAERTPATVLEDLEAAIEEIGFDLEDHAHADLSRGLHCARVLQALETDPDIPTGTADALRRGQRTSAPGVFSSLRQAATFVQQYGDGNLDAGMQRLAVFHPGAYEIIRDLEEQLMGRRRFYQQWSAEGQPPGCLPDAVAEPLLERARELNASGILGPVEIITGIATLVLSLTGMVSVTVAVFVLACLALVGWIQSKREPMDPDPVAWMNTWDAHQSTFGIWRHEMLAAGEQFAIPVPPMVKALLFRDENADLRTLSTAHGYRSTCMMQVDDAPPDDDSAADTKEQDVN